MSEQTGQMIPPNARTRMLGTDFDVRTFADHAIHLTDVPGQAWMERWIAHPELRPEHRDDEPRPGGYGYRVPEDGMVEFFARFLADGEDVLVSITRQASDLGLRITDAGGLEPIA